MKYLGNPDTLLHSEPHKSINTQLCRQRSSALHGNAALRAQQLVEALKEIRVQIQKSLIENLEEIIVLRIGKFSLLQGLEQLVGLAGSNLAAYQAPHRFQFLGIR